MSDAGMGAPGGDDGAATNDRFQWHPEYRGQSVAEVRQKIRGDVAHDQRAYKLAMEGAEHEENAALSAVIDLEKRWGTYSLDWAEADADALADRIVAFEQERDRRQELFSYRDFGREGTTTPPPRTVSGMTTGTSSPGIRWGAVLALAVVVIVILILILT